MITFVFNFLKMSQQCQGGITKGMNDNGNYLSSTENFIHDKNDWRYAASLPSPRDGLSGATIGNTVFVFGKIYNFTLHLT